MISDESAFEWAPTCPMLIVQKLTVITASNGYRWPVVLISKPLLDQMTSNPLQKSEFKNSQAFRQESQNADNF